MKTFTQSNVTEKFQQGPRMRRRIERRNRQRKVNRREEDRFGGGRDGRLSPPAKNPGDGETKIISPDKSGQSLPGKGDPCVGHPAARISVVVRPVLFFQVLFLSVSDSLPFSLSPTRAFLFFSSPRVSRRHGPPDCRRQLSPVP